MCNFPTNYFFRFFHSLLTLPISPGKKEVHCIPAIAKAIITAFVEGSDRILDLGISRTKIELWHHDVDGRSETFFDWPCTESYCRAIANYFKIPIYFSWKDGGFKNELLRENKKAYEFLMSL